jgi:hypothetical protein
VLRLCHGVPPHLLSCLCIYNFDGFITACLCWQQWHKIVKLLSYTACSVLHGDAQMIRSWHSMEQPEQNLDYLQCMFTRGHPTDRKDDLSDMS